MIRGRWKGSQAQGPSTHVVRCGPRVWPHVAHTRPHTCLVHTCLLGGGARAGPAWGPPSPAVPGYSSGSVLHRA